MALHRTKNDDALVKSQSQDRNEDDDFLRPEDKLRSGTIILNLAKDYARNWTTSESFREIFQNWRDWPMQFFGLKHDDLIFQPEDLESGSVYVIKLSSPALRRYLGYIKYNKKTRTLSITNYEASLTRESLRLGHSTKGNNANLAGTHGEGLKVASLVMVRSGHPLKLETSRFWWRFEFSTKNPTEFICRLRNPPSNMLQKKEKEYIERREEDFCSKLPESNVCGDMTVIIENVDFVELKEWLKPCLDLESQPEVIKTGKGSIILDPAYSGRIYLKGLLLQQHPAGAPGRQFKYGYNLSNGNVNRDRRSLVSSREEEERIMQIWIQAIYNNTANTDNPNSNLKAVDLFIDLLTDAEKHHWAEARNAQYYITEIVAKEMRKYYREKNSKKEIFYHGQRNADIAVKIIEGSLKRRPVQLPNSIWDPLSGLGLFRTPLQEQRHLLNRAPESNIKQTPFYVTLRRMLRTALVLDERTRRLGLLIKSGGKADIALLIVDSTVLVHERWFDFYACHARSPCQISDRDLAKPSNKDYNYEPFLCDHVVNYLYGLLLEQLMPGSCYGGQISTDRLRTQVSECVEQMPRKVEIAQGSERGSIKVSWMDIAGGRAKSNGIDLRCRITLHESACKEKRDDLLTQESISEDSTQLYVQGTAECGCPAQVVLQKDSEAYFGGLDLETEYYPMVASQNANAFYAPPPKALRPNQIHNDSTHTHGISASSSCAAGSVHVEEHDSDADTRGISSRKEDSMDTDSSRTTPMERVSPNGRQQARPQPGIPGAASQNKEAFEKEIRDLHQRVQQLQAEESQLQEENCELRTELAASIQISTDIKGKYSVLEETLKTEQRYTTVLKQRIYSSLLPAREGINKSFADLAYDHRQGPSTMTRTRKSVEPQGNASSSLAGNKRELDGVTGPAAAAVEGGGEGGEERAAKRHRPEAGRVNLTGAGEESC